MVGVATAAQWQSLGEGAQRLWSLAPWQWMDGSELFGVRHPTSREIGWCCVMGAGGRLNGLAVYRGARGFDDYIKTRDGLVDADEMHAAQDALLLTFGDREELSKAEREAINATGLRFRGRRRWPKFESFRPGYAPWRLEEDEADLMVAALDQTCEVATALRGDRTPLDALPAEHWLLRVPEPSPAGLTWRNEAIVAEPFELPVEPIMLDEVKIARLARDAKRADVVWEIDEFSSAAQVIAEPGRRPYFARTFLVAESARGMIIHVHVDEPAAGAAMCATELLRTIENIGVLPKAFGVCRERVANALERVAAKLDVRLVRVDALPLIENCRAGMDAFLAR